MIDDEQIVFLLGVPGSAWSRHAYLLEGSPLFNLNTSDKRPDREYTVWPKSHTAVWPNAWYGDPPRLQHIVLPNHHGAYFDPGMEFGNMMHTGKYTKEHLIEEILQAWEEHDDRRYLVKSHWLGTKIDWIRENFPGSRIVITIRDLRDCYDWWQHAGGSSIDYPNYQWFMERGWKETFQTIDWHLKRFVDTESTPPVFPTTKYCKEVLKLNIDDDKIKYHIGHARGLRAEYENGAAHTYPSLISYYNCEDLFDT